MSAWEKLKKLAKDIKFCAVEAYNNYCQQLADFVTIEEKRNQVEATCGKNIALCFHEDALRIAKTRCAKEVDTYRELADECIKMFLDGVSEGKSNGELQNEVVFYFSILEREK